MTGPDMSEDVLGDSLSNLASSPAKPTWRDDPIGGKQRQPMWVANQRREYRAVTLHFHSYQHFHHMRPAKRPGGAAELPQT